MIIFCIRYQHILFFHFFESHVKISFFLYKNDIFVWKSSRNIIFYVTFYAESQKLGPIPYFVERKM